MPPTIDTSVARSMYSASSRSARISYCDPSPPGPRTRVLSTASTSSSISLVTPVPSSGNPSSSSLDLANTTESAKDSVAFASASEEGASYSDEDEDEEAPPNGLVRALHDFVPQQQNATCLAFCAGEIIRVLNRDPSGWWDGEIDGRRGWFPSNYVGSVNDGEPHAALPAKAHVRSMSDTSFTSRASTASPMHQSKHDSVGGDSLFPASANHTPPLMVPLLHGLQLLQNTTLVRRVSHYQPAVACIIQCIRALLQQTECLARGAPLLRRFPVIAQSRKRVLADLALLVTQSKKASSSEFQSDEERDPEEELMLRLAGQVFARVRRFLAVVVQCGVDLPERNFPSTADTSASETVCDDSVVLHNDTENVRRQYGFQADDGFCYSAPAHEGADVGGKDHTARSSLESNSTSRSSKRSSHVSTTVAGNLVHNRYHGHHMSLSSSSSFSSFSSLESPDTPPSPPFPEGPCTAMQVQQALRSTHDSLLSTIAAFIGHVHAHSRAAHASSTGHLFALVRQIVDVVCRLLTVVDAVVCVESVPWVKRAALETAKENLYQVACALADAVREMATSTRIPPSEEEEERRRLLKVATDALKAGSDCVSAVKTCLARPLNASPYVIILPSMTDSATPSMESTEGGSFEQSSSQDGYLDEDRGWDDAEDGKRASVASGGTVLPQALDELHEQVQLGYATTTADYEFDNEDATVHPLKRSLPGGRTPKPAYSVDEDEHSSTSPAIPERDRQSFIAALSVDFSEPIEEETSEDEDRSSSEKDLPSPTSQVHTNAFSTVEETAWEGNRRHKSLEDKLFHGELPSIPQTSDEDGNIPLAWTLSHDYAPQDVAYNSEGQLVGATLEALVEKMTTHDQIPDAGFSAVFFLTFRLFTSPNGLVEAVISRFNLAQPNGLSEADAVLWSQQKLLPVRLRVQNLLKLWLEVYWRVGTDDEALPALQSFVRGTMAEVFAGPAQRLDDLIASRGSMSAAQPISPLSERQRLNERLRDAGMPVNPSLVSGSSSSDIPRPIMTKALLASLRARNFASIAVTDFDALELARQMTLVESQLYSAITAEEMIELGRPGAPPAVNVKAVSALSTAITGWVSESILGEQDVKRRAMLMKFFIKVADRCTSLNNFSTPRSILAALDSSTISRLHQTWSGLAQKSKIQLEALRKLADHARNYHEYRSRLRNTAPPAVPFLGLYLTDLTFCREGNPSHRTSPLVPNKKLLNFNKYHKLARIVQDMQRFQVAYKLKDVAEAQQYLQFCFEKAKDHGDLDDLYRRSQLLEPKRAAEAPAASELKSSIFGWGNRSQASSSQATIA